MFRLGDRFFWVEGWGMRKNFVFIILIVFIFCFWCFSYRIENFVGVDDFVFEFYCDYDFIVFILIFEGV